METIRLMLVDDDPLVRQSLADLLSMESDFEIVGEAPNGRAAVVGCSEFSPDLILMDIRMPEMNGVDASREILMRDSHVRIIMLTTFDEDEFIIGSLEAGASGYLLKDTDPDDLAAAIRIVHKGNTQLGPSIAPKVLSRLRIQVREEKLEAQNEELQRLANYDPLTQLLNRRGLDQVLIMESEQATASKQPLVAVMLDFDDFKSINERFGHVGGDIVLTEVASRISRAVRPCDQVSRIGGDEFVIIIPQAALEEALGIAERVRRAIADHLVRVNAESISVSASFGVAPLPLGIRSLEDLLSLTRLALKQSKGAGKNQVSSSTAPLKSDQTETVQLVQGLRTGTALRVVSERIVELRTEKIIGYEYMCRGPSGFFELPQDFLKLSIEHNILSTTDLNCLKACLAKSTEGGASDLYVHVNVHPETLADVSIKDLIETIKVAGDKVCIEFNENLLVGDASRFESKLNELKEANIKIAIDGVGGGKTYLETILAIEPDFVKLDPSLSTKITADPQKRKRVSQLVGIMQSINSKIIATGIDHADDRDALIDLSVSFGQGRLWDCLNETAL